MICVWFSATKFNSNSHSDPFRGFWSFSAQKSKKFSAVLEFCGKRKEKIEEKKKEKRKNWKLRKKLFDGDLSALGVTGKKDSVAKRGQKRGGKQAKRS
jgi:hypothetical protein